MVKISVSELTLVLILTLAGTALADPPHAYRPPPRAFGDWRLVCGDAGCAALTAVAAADGSEALRLSLDRASGGVLAVATALPLLLPEGLSVTIGAEAPRPAAWRTCGRDGCVAWLPVDAALAAAVRRERAGSAALTLADGSRVRLPFSLIGATAALRALGDAP